MCVIAYGRGGKKANEVCLMWMGPFRIKLNKYSHKSIKQMLKVGDEHFEKYIEFNLTNHVVYSVSFST